MSIKPLEIMADLEVTYIVLTKTVVLCNAIDKKYIEENVPNDKLESLFLVECNHCKPHDAYVIKNTDLAKGIVANELLRRRESEGSNE